MSPLQRRRSQGLNGLSAGAISPRLVDFLHLGAAGAEGCSRTGTPAMEAAVEASPRCCMDALLFPTRRELCSSRGRSRVGGLLLHGHLLHFHSSTLSFFTTAGDFNQRRLKPAGPKFYQHMKAGRHLPHGGSYDHLDVMLQTSGEGNCNTGLERRNTHAPVPFTGFSWALNTLVPPQQVERLRKVQVINQSNSWEHLSEHRRSSRLRSEPFVA